MDASLHSLLHAAGDEPPGRGLLAAAPDATAAAALPLASLSQAMAMFSQYGAQVLKLQALSAELSASNAVKVGQRGLVPAAARRRARNRGKPNWGPCAHADTHAAHPLESPVAGRPGNAGQ